LRDICGFGHCTSLRRIAIPSSVETIKSNGFFGCTSLSEITFSSDSHLKRISGFGQCTSLRRIEIPSSVETIDPSGFLKCISLRVVIMRAGCQIRTNEGLLKIRPFVVYEENDLKESRRMIHVGIVRRRQ
jgi:hypothetical protein